MAYKPFINKIIEECYDSKITSFEEYLVSPHCVETNELSIDWRNTRKAIGIENLQSRITQDQEAYSAQIKTEKERQILNMKIKIQLDAEKHQKVMIPDFEIRDDHRKEYRLEKDTDILNKDEIVIFIEEYTKYLIDVIEMKKQLKVFETKLKNVQLKPTESDFQDVLKSIKDDFSTVGDVLGGKKSFKDTGLEGPDDPQSLQDRKGLLDKLKEKVEIAMKNFTARQRHKKQVTVSKDWMTPIKSKRAALEQKSKERKARVAARKMARAQTTLHGSRGRRLAGTPAVLAAMMEEIIFRQIEDDILNGLVPGTGKHGFCV